MLYTILASISAGSGRRKLRMAPRRTPQDDGKNSKEYLEDLLCCLIQEKLTEQLSGGTSVDLRGVKSWPQTWEETETKTLRLEKETPTSFSYDPVLNDKIALWTGNIVNLEKVDAIVCGRTTDPFDRNSSPCAAIKCVGLPLHANYVIETAFVRGDLNSLRTAYHNSFNLMLTHGLRTIAFERIGVADGFTDGLIAETAITMTRSFLELHWKRVDRIVFVLPRSIELRIYSDACQEFFPLVVPGGLKEF